MSKFLLLINVLLIIIPSFGQTESTPGQKANRLIKVLQNTHYLPIKHNNTTSAEIIGKFMQNLDPTGIYFLKEDQQTFMNYADSLSENIEKYTNILINYATNIYSKRLHEADSLIPEILHQAFDFHKLEQLDISDDGYKNYPLDQAKFIDNWRKILKARLLRELFLMGKDSVDRFSLTENDLNAYVSQTTEKVLLKSRWKIRKVLEYPDGFDVYIQSAYLNAITSAYDPHTEYFTKIKKDEFEESLSKENESYGLNFTNNTNGEIEITGITFGSPAWYSDAFETGDVIVGIKPEGSKDVDLTFLESNDLWEIINSGKNQVSDFSVKKKDYKIVLIRLEKSKIESANHARSFILKSNKTIGYIYLPSFYIGKGHIRGNGCALDIMREIIKLENDGIEGILLDLRQNGGGSIAEAIGIASTFIKDGSIATIINSGSFKERLERVEPGITCNKPLVVMVDMFSASAAENITGILQTYNRAVVVGERTFGKHTGQFILPINREMSNQNDNLNFGDLGYVKVTVEKTYMPNGISYQGIGITPDIQLPFLYNEDKYREIGLKNAMKPDTIEIDKNFKPLSQLPLEILKAKSAVRVAGNKNFQAIESLKNEFAESKFLYDRINLNFDVFKKDLQLFNHFSSTYEDILNQAKTAFTISYNNFDLEKFKNDSNEKAINEKFIEMLKRDFYLEESFFVLEDLIDAVPSIK